jgi:hypothetical protein
MSGTRTPETCTRTVRADHTQDCRSNCLTSLDKDTISRFGFFVCRGDCVIWNSCYSHHSAHIKVFSWFDKERTHSRTETSDSFLSGVTSMNRSVLTVGQSHAVDQTIRNDDAIRVRAKPTETTPEQFVEAETPSTFRRASTDSEEKSPPRGASKQAASSVQATVAAAPSDLVRAGFASEPSRETLRLGFHALSALDGADIPEYVREHNATLSFPETVCVNGIPSLPVLDSMSNAFRFFFSSPSQLMLMLMHVEKECAKSGRKPGHAPIAWIPDGKSFVIRSKEKLVSDLLPQFFRQGKFSSFTRKLYRWGFRQVNMQRDRQPQAMYFGNEFFQRDNKALLSKMRSTTAAGIRREKAAGSKQCDEDPTGFQPQLQTVDSRGLPGLSLPSILFPNDRALAAQPRMISLPSIVFPSDRALAAQPRMTEPSLLTMGAYQQSRIQSAMFDEALANAQLQRQLAMQQASLQCQDQAAGQYLRALSQLSAAPQMPHAHVPQRHLCTPMPPVVAGFPSSGSLQQAVTERECLIAMLLQQTHQPPLR